MKPFLSFLLLVGLCTVACAQTPTFVAHPDTADAQLSVDEVRSVLLGTKNRWSNGTPIKLVIHASGAVHDQVIAKYAERKADQFEKYWKKQVFTGKGSMPEIAKTDADVIAFVSSTPGAFGYVDQANVGAKVKTISVK